MGTILLIVYLAGCLGFLVPIARFLLKEVTFGEPEGGDYWMAAVMSVMCSWMWPILVPGWWIVHMLKNSEVK